MRFQRGQAFETMMLVISVIVALAILAVLTGILNNFNGQFGGDPKSVIHDGLRAVVSRGFGIEPAKGATFDKGTIILKRDVMGADVPIQQTDLRFFVSSDIGAGVPCGASSGVKPLNTGAAPTGTSAFKTLTGAAAGDSIEVCSKIQAQISVCGDGSTSLYCVSIARQANDATNNCKTACGLS